MKRRYHTLDVFTDTPFAGNPLAVVLDSDGLDDVSMQTIAAEFNLSETVFVKPPETTDGTARIKIFTPAHELPFAGHPTVGTAILLSQLNHLEDGAELILEENVGPVKCMISEGAQGKTARFDLPRESERVEWDYDPDMLAQSLGLSPSDFGFDDHEVSIWNGGVPYSLVPVRDIDCVRNIKIDTAALSHVEPMIDGLASNLYVYCRGGETAGASFHCRMFAPLWGIPEDPATGSAVASFSGQLAAHEMGEDEEKSFVIEQGYEMGRPSQILLDITKKDGQVVEAGISGSAVQLSEGVLNF